jgi:hypothetical protein
MSIRTGYLRAAKYLQLHGLKPSLNRVWREAKIKLFQNRVVIYSLDLLHSEFDEFAMPENCRVEKYNKESEIPERLIKHIAEYYSEELLKDNIRKRFEKGAYLWCLRNDTEYIGYLWSIVGRTMKPYYFFPLTARDVHLNDGLIFPPHQGHGMFSLLNNHIFKHYKNEGFHWIYQEVAEWNNASMKSAVKHGFTRIGLARMRFSHGKSKVTWWY